MDWTRTIVEVIDMRSFSNLWFWIVLAVMWSSASHYILGVPFDMIQRARRQGGQALVDLQDLVRINVNRILGIMEMAGSWLIGIVAFMLTLLALLGFWYRVEFAQAVTLLAVPMSFTGWRAVRAARAIALDPPEGDALFRTLIRFRFWTQVTGMIAIFITAIYGMYQNMVVPYGY